MSANDEHGLISGSGESDNKRPGKIFVGGLTWDTTVDDVKNYFRRFGNILDATIVKDPITTRSRGFGFVVFEDSSVLKQIFSAESHYINGKKVDTKNAFRRNVEQACRKIFVGGVDPALPESEIREYFSGYGPIDEIDLPWDKDKNQRRAFCFVAFQSSDVVEQIIKQSKHKLGDRMVDVKKATPKQDNNSINASNNLALSILSQALSLGNNSSNGSANNLLANLLGANQSSNLAAALGGLSPNNVLPSLGGLGGYPGSYASQGVSSVPANPMGASIQTIQGPPAMAASSNPYMALAAAAAAAGLIPSAATNTAPGMDLASWYSQLALVAAMASSQEGTHIPHGSGIGSPVPAVMQQAYHRDNPIIHQSMQAAAASHHHTGASMLPLTGSHHTGNYGKSARSGGPMSGTGGTGGTTVGTHRGNVQYHPYSR